MYYYDINKIEDSGLEESLGEIGRVVAKTDEDLFNTYMSKIKPYYITADAESSKPKLFKPIIDNKDIVIQKDSKRNLIGIAEVVKIVNKLIKNKCSGIYEVGDLSSYTIKEIVETIVDILGIEANVKFKSGGYSIPVDLRKIIQAIPNYNNFFESGYMRKTLDKKIKGYI